MSAPEKFLTAHLGEAEVRVPEKLAIAAYLEQQLDLVRPLSIELAQTVDRIHTGRLQVPPIGEVWDKDGIYAGVTLHEDKPHALILLAGESPELKWANAIEWAKKQGGELPSRIDGLVLFKNLKREFKEEYYWLNEQHADAAGSAWYQLFGWGGQRDCDVSDEVRARAVRRVAI